MRIGSIAWQGNRLLSASQLNQALGLRPGGPYDSVEVQARLARRPDAHDIPLRYLDHGYFFFTITTVVLRHPSGLTNLTFIFSEGRPTQWGTIAIVGGRRAPTAELLATSGFFEPTKVGVMSRPVRRPRDFTDLADLAFTVLER